MNPWGAPRAFVLALALSCLIAPPAGATSVASKSLDEIVHGSDHALLATVVRVDMVDGLGRPVEDREARTGPGLRNRIRLHLDVREVLSTNCSRQPRRVTVALWSMWHYSLGAIRDQVQGSEGIFLLKGADFEPAYYEDFQRAIEERPQIQARLDALRLQRKPERIDCRQDSLHVSPANPA
ncbi:hypothetical protein [Luteimonas aquatica]|uniref:hypothetical protein n=1 Tax=Luteimonas aquatica TaxID=450364 RepID=UPI001F58D515|nr:hypothetical protein [Luteimonas aquatica]